MEKKREYLRGDEDDIEKAKYPEKSPLDADWLEADHGQGDRWADKGKDGPGEGKARSWSHACGHALYAGLLASEFGLWILVMHIWKSSPEYTYFFYVLLPVLLPSLTIPCLSILHSITRGRLSFKESLLFFVPPSPVLLHCSLLAKALSTTPGTYAEIVRQSRLSRVAGLVQACVMSFPLVLLSFKILILGTIENNSLDAGSFHIYLHSNKMMFMGATLSLVNILVAAYRYNERLTGRPVALLVGVPFLLATILFRIIGFGLLLSFFDEAWIFLCLGIMFAMSAISVQLASNLTICGRIFRGVFGDFDESGSGSPERKSSIFSSFLLSLGGVFLPVGYTRDQRLGHVSGRGWRLILVNCVGSLAILSTVMSTAVVQYIPNTVVVQQLVDMVMKMAAMEVTIKTSGKEIKFDLPQTRMSMFAEDPVRGSLTLSRHDMIYISYIMPAFLCLLVLPFTILRIILLGWDCRLERSRDEQDIFSERRRVSSSRSCCAVLWSVSALMSFTLLASLVVGVWVLCTVLAHVQPMEAVHEEI